MQCNLQLAAHLSLFHMRESVIEHRLCVEIKKRGGLCLKWESPGYNGVPDRIVIMPNQIIFVELKAPGRVPRPLQEYVHRLLRNLGCRVQVIDNVEGVLKFVNAL